MICLSAHFEVGWWGVKSRVEICCSLRSFLFSERTLKTLIHFIFLFSLVTSLSLQRNNSSFFADINTVKAPCYPSGHLIDSLIMIGRGGRYIIMRTNMACGCVYHHMEPSGWQINRVVTHNSKRHLIDLIVVHSYCISYWPFFTASKVCIGRVEFQEVNNWRFFGLSYKHSRHTKKQVSHREAISNWGVVDKLWVFSSSPSNGFISLNITLLSAPWAGYVSHDMFEIDGTLTRKEKGGIP